MGKGWQGCTVRVGMWSVCKLVLALWRSFHVPPTVLCHAQLPLREFVARLF